MSIRTALIALAALAPIAAPALPPPVTTIWDGRVADRDDNALRATMLVAHNAARADHGAQSLRWNADLAADARAYAEAMARSGRFEHDSQRDTDERQGENLFMGTRGAFNYAEMADGWIEERKHFRAGEFPQVSRSGDWTDVGHYTQVVWPGTREVGCAVASNARDDFLVCRYLPAGNVIGIALR
jgi:Cysteine-rich secretory protein family